MNQQWFSYGRLGWILVILMFGFSFLSPAPERVPLQASSTKPLAKCANDAVGPYVRLLGWEFDPLCQPEPPYIPASLRLEFYPDGEMGYYLVQFQGPIQPDWKDAVTKTGAVLLDYIPDYTFITRMEDGTRKLVAEMPVVRWIGIYHPGYRLSPSLLVETLGEASKTSTAADLRVSIFPGEDFGALQNQVKSMAVIEPAAVNQLGMLMNVHADVATIQRLATLTGVRWIEAAPEWELYNEISADIMDVRDTWNTHGLYGSGQIVGVCDTGLDQGSTSPTSLHNDFENGAGVSRVIQLYDRVGDGGNDPNSGHGTHVAGSVLGNGYNSGSTPTTHTYPSTSFAGMAPEAQLVFQAVEDADGYLTGIPADLTTLFSQSYNAGARIHSNSWGSADAGVYTTDSQNTDLFSWNNRLFTILFAAGNDGADVNSANGIVDLMNVGSPGTSKNCITIGASENNRSTGGINPGATTCSGTPTCAPSGGAYWGNCWPADFAATPVCTDRVSNNAGGMAAFSSRGPTADGRYKPDIVAPGTNILSTRSSVATEAAWGNYNTYYWYMGGTSMATPLTAGASALVREFYTDQSVTPSSALIKATLVNGATDLYPGQYASPYYEQPTVRPNNVQGWGRVDIEDSLFPVSPSQLDYFDFTQGLITNEYDTFTFNLSNMTVPLKATLAWTDYPGTPAAGGGLVNDLDLHVVDPAFTIHYPTNASQRGATQIGINDTDAYSTANSSTSRRYAMKFTPTSYPVVVDKALLYPYAASYPVSMNVWIYDDDGTSGAPGTALTIAQTFRASFAGWWAYDTTDVTISSGSFYVAWQPGATNAPYVIVDQANGGGADYQYSDTTWSVRTGGDLCVRAVMKKADISTSYDRVNNLVGVDLTPSATGSYTTRVAAYNVAQGPQPYALVHSGAVALTGASSYRIFSSGDVASKTFGRAGVDMDFTSGPGGNVTITMNKTAPANPPPFGKLFMNLNWDISSAMTGFSTQVIFHYNDSDLPVGLTEANLVGAYRWNTGTSSWDRVGGTIDTTLNTVTVSGVTQFSNWTLGGNDPTPVVVSGIRATPGLFYIRYNWQTALEIDVLGFNVYRSDSADGERVCLNNEMILAQAPGGALGADYEFVDTAAVLPGKQYFYWLEVVEVGGASIFGPLPAGVYPMYLPVMTQ